MPRMNRYMYPTGAAFHASGPIRDRSAENGPSPVTGLGPSPSSVDRSFRSPVDSLANLSHYKIFHDFMHMRAKTICAAVCRRKIGQAHRSCHAAACWREAEPDSSGTGARQRWHRNREYNRSRMAGEEDTVMRGRFSYKVTIAPRRRLPGHVKQWAGVLNPHLMAVSNRNKKSRRMSARRMSARRMSA